VLPDYRGVQRREPTVPGSLDRPDRQHAPDPLDANDVPEQLRPASPRPDLPGVADRSEATDHLVTSDRPERWSRADLSQRLERLPPGHPSSLLSDDPDTDELPGLRDPDLPSPTEKTEEERSGRRGAGTPEHTRNDNRDSGNEMPGVPHASGREADTTPTSGLDDPDRPADAVKRNYWSEVPRFLRAWSDHVRRWPAELVTAVVDRSRDSQGSWRGDGNQYLDPERHAQSNDVIAGVRQTEKKVTEHVKEAERDNTCSGWLEGLEHRIKGEDRLKEKIADLLETGAPDATIGEIARQIPDAIRYTFCTQPENYKDVYWDIKDRLQAHRYEMYYSENHWPDTQYKGINTRWITPEGQRFEVQFHTPESFHAKQTITHSSYGRLRNALTRDDERRELMAFQQEVCSWITGPEGATDIPNYRGEGY
jgi:hypothetical protein